MIAIINFDFGAMSIILNDFQLIYHITLDQAQRIISLYLIFAASFFIVSGKLIDTFSPAKVYKLGIIIFCFSIPFIIFNASLEIVYIVRCLQGISYSLIYNSGVILLNTMYPPKNKFSGVTLMILISMLVQIFGTGLAGILVEFYGWKGVFSLTGIASVFSLFLLFTPYSKDVPLTVVDTGKLNLRGCFFFLVFCVLISYPILYNLGHERTTMLLMLATFYGAYFIYKTYRNKISFIDVRLLKNAYFSSIVILRCFSNVCWSILILYIPTYLQQEFSFSPSEAGFFLLTTSSIAAIWVLLSDLITKKWGVYRSLLFPTLCLFTLHIIMFSYAQSPSPHILGIVLILYSFTGLIIPILTKSCFSHIDDKIKGQGVGIYYTLSLLSMGLGGIILGKLPAILETFPFIGNFWNIISLICIFLYTISLLTLALTRRYYQMPLHQLTINEN